MSDPNMIMNFANNQPQLLTGIGQGLRGLGQGLIRNKLAKDEAEKRGKFDVLTNRFLDSGDTSLLPQIQQMYPEEYEGIIKTWDSMDEIDRKFKVQENMEIIGYLGSETDPEKQAGRLAEMARAYRNDGEDADADVLQEFSRQALNGEGKQVQRRLEAITSAIPEGQTALASLSTMRGDVIGEGKYALEIMKTGFDFEGDQAALDSAVEAAKSDPEFGAENLAALRYAKALRGGLGYNPTEFNTTLFGLGDKFQKNAKRFFDERTANTTLNDAIDMATSIATKTGDSADPLALGNADIAAINLFQRQIDPATVREGDVQLIRQAESLAEKFKTMAKGWTTGAVLSVGQRASMKELSAKIVEAQKAKVDEVYYPASHASFKRVVNEAGRSGNIEELWKEVYSGYEPVGEEIKKKEDDTVVVEPDDPATLTSAKDYFRSTAQASLNAKDGKWSKAELDKINDPNTTLAELEEMGSKTMAAFKAGNVSSGATNLNISPIPEGEDMSGWGEDVNNG